MLARRDALSALGAAPADQQLAVLDAVAAVFQKEGVSLAPLGPSLPLADQLAIHAEWVQRIPEARRAVKRQRQDMSHEQLEQRKAPRRRPNHPRATNPSSHVLHVPSQEASTNKRLKTVETYNAHRPSGMAATPRATATLA